MLAPSQSHPWLPFSTPYRICSPSPRAFPKGELYQDMKACDSRWKRATQEWEDDNKANIPFLSTAFGPCSRVPSLVCLVCLIPAVRIVLLSWCTIFHFSCLATLVLFAFGRGPKAQHGSYHNPSLPRGTIFAPARSRLILASCRCVRCCDLTNRVLMLPRVVGASSVPETGTI